ncbi:MAG: acetyltransferase [Chitinophagaceae bacterium]|nr:acetyltransferase [Chitinophagaceae bacterium]MBL0055615.1 acetyltransferase [Chitinophagaceae bacterium]
MILIGYSGHAFVVCGILKAAGISPSGYCDQSEKSFNPFSLSYFGPEGSDSGMKAIGEHGFFIAIGDNVIRGQVYDQLAAKDLLPGNAIHPHAVIDPSATVASHGVMIAAGVVINPLAQLGIGVICNTGSIIEHECRVGSFAHIGPGAVLCGNVSVGERSFVGANAVIRQGIKIGHQVTIGAGAVVVKDIPDNTTVMGVPAK